MVEVMSEALTEVVIPAMEDMEKRLRNDLASKEDVGELKLNVERVERKLDAFQNRLDRHGQMLDKHETDIKKLQLSTS